MKSKYWSTCVLGSALSLALAAGVAHAQTIQAADPNIQGDGTLGPAAAKAMNRGRLLMNEADAAAKAAATGAAVADEKSAAPSSGPTAEEGGNAPLAAVVGGHSFAGQNAGNSSPSDATGAIGPVSYIQMINTSARIYNRNTHAVIATATLNQMAGQAATVNSFDPQIMWDPSTNRFYYVMDSVFSASNNKLSFGFSKTANPTNFTTSWCKYQVNYGARFPDYPKLGDSHHFIIIGVNSFQGSFVGSDIFAIGKPPAGTTCPLASSFPFGVKQDLRDTSNLQTFTPVPSNQVDTNGTGYVVTRNGGLPSTSLWFYNVTRNSSTGAPVFGTARRLIVPSYTVPPDASQPTFTQLLDTLDARPTQAVQARNPDRGAIQSFWVQHTVRQTSANLAEVRWYEINPAPATPVLLRSGKINSTTSHFYNAAISPDRRRDGRTLAFGDSFVINYNVSGSASGLSPRIVAGSSFSGRALGGFVLVRNAVGPFRDFTCPSGGQVCRWGDYAQASPDPRPTFAGRGQVWGTSNYSGVAAPSTSASNFRTWIFDLRP